MDIHKPICLPVLPNALGGHQDVFQSSVGKVYYTVKGKGQPLLMIHGINGGASNFTWRENFDFFSKYFKVYAIDLVGFGRSDKLPMIYDYDVYIKAILEVIYYLIKQPTFILSSGLAAAYCLYLAHCYPKWITKLALITPSGITTNASAPCETSFVTFNLFTSPIQGDAIYNAFVSPKSIDYFLKDRIYTYPKNVTRLVVQYTFQAAHQCPNASYAPASFVAGLSNLNISNIIPNIKQPTLIMWGKQAKLGNYRTLYTFKALNTRFMTYLFENSGLVPQIEEHDLFNHVVADFFTEGLSIPFREE